LCIKKKLRQKQEFSTRRLFIHNIIMASKIKELKDTVVHQTEVVKTLRTDQIAVREVVHELYRMLVKYKPEFIGDKTMLESADTLDVKGEDITSRPTPELIRRIGVAFGSVTQSLSAVRNEVREVYRELDGDVDAALQEWQEIQIGAKHDKKAETFRSDIMEKASQERPQTPELGRTVVPAVGGTLPPTPPDAPGKKDTRPLAISKPSAGTTTLGAMLSPTASAAPTTPKDTSVAKGRGVAKK
jgi:hypothetical protein